MIKPDAHIRIINEEIDDNSHLVDAVVVERPETPEPVLEMQRRYTTEEMKERWEHVLREGRKSAHNQISTLKKVQREKDEVS